MTLIQVLDLIKLVATSHKMVRSYQQQGLIPEFDNQDNISLPVVNVLVAPGTISVPGKLTTYGFEIFIEDLVNVASDTKANEWDVVSDCEGIAEDLLAQLNNPNYSWRISEATMEYLFENDNSMRAGVKISFSISVPYDANRCQVPSEIVPIDNNSNDVKVYDLIYTATGNEGTALSSDTIAALAPIKGKKIVFMTREYNTLFRVSNNPDSTQYTWNDTSIGLSMSLNPNERLLILYRNY